MFAVQILAVRYHAEKSDGIRHEKFKMEHMNKK
jgi:hypothetical protein